MVFGLIRFSIFIVLILFAWEISPGKFSGTTPIRFNGNLSPQTLSLIDRESVPEKETARIRINTIKKYRIMFFLYNIQSLKFKMALITGAKKNLQVSHNILIRELYISKLKFYPGKAN